jgi:hypothetical protein
VALIFVVSLIVVVGEADDYYELLDECLHQRYDDYL